MFATYSDDLLRGVLFIASASVFYLPLVSLVHQSFSQGEATTVSQGADNLDVEMTLSTRSLFVGALSTYYGMRFEALIGFLTSVVVVLSLAFSSIPTLPGVLLSFLFGGILAMSIQDLVERYVFTNVTLGLSLALTIYFSIYHYSISPVIFGAGIYLVFILTSLGVQRFTGSKGRAIYPIDLVGLFPLGASLYLGADAVTHEVFGYAPLPALIAIVGLLLAFVLTGSGLIAYVHAKFRGLKDAGYPFILAVGVATIIGFLVALEPPAALGNLLVLLGP